MVALRSCFRLWAIYAQEIAVGNQATVDVA